MNKKSLLTVDVKIKDFDEVKKTLENQQKIIESQARIIEDMVSDYEEVQERIGLILSDVKHANETVCLGEHDEALDEAIRGLQFLEKYVNGWLIKID